MKPWILAVAGTLTSIAAAAACSSSSGNGTPGGGDGGSSSGGGEGGSGSGGGEGGGSSSGGALPYFGTLTAAKTSAATPVYTLSGGFIAVGDASPATADASATANCTGTVSGSCCFTPPGTASDAGVADGGSVSLVSAGTITVDDGTTAIAALNPGTNEGYGIASTNNPSVKWQPGDTLSFSAAGATVQSFKGSVVAVQDFAGVTPALSYTTPSTVPIKSDFVVTWTAGNGSTVRLFVDALKGTAQQGAITCDAPDSAGSVTVPAALLGHLATGDTGVATLTRGTTSTVKGGNAQVSILSSVTTGGSLKFQ